MLVQVGAVRADLWSLSMTCKPLRALVQKHCPRVAMVGDSTTVAQLLDMPISLLWASNLDAYHAFTATSPTVRDTIKFIEINFYAGDCGITWMAYYKNWSGISQIAECIHHNHQQHVPTRSGFVWLSENYKANLLGSPDLVACLPMVFHADIREYYLDAAVAGTCLEVMPGAHADADIREIFADIVFLSVVVGVNPFANQEPLHPLGLIPRISVSEFILDVCRSGGRKKCAGREREVLRSFGDYMQMRAGIRWTKVCEASELANELYDIAEEEGYVFRSDVGRVLEWSEESGWSELLEESEESE